MYLSYCALSVIIIIVIIIILEIFIFDTTLCSLHFIRLLNNDLNNVTVA